MCFYLLDNTYYAVGYYYRKHILFYQTCLCESCLSVISFEFYIANMSIFKYKKKWQTTNKMCVMCFIGC